MRHRQALADARRARRTPRKYKSPAAQPARLKLDNRLRSLYGITLDRYEAMYAAQSGLCAVCGYPPEGRGKGDTLVVDHCHSQGHVRALLCGKCNIALGLLDDDPRLVDAAADYLRSWVPSA